MGEQKQFITIVGPTVRSIINEANESNVKKEEVVTIMESNGYYYLIYCR